MKVYVGADHNGFFLKNDVIKYLKSKRIPVEDVGAFRFDKDDDYPVFAKKVAEQVTQDPEHMKGIIVCASGTGIAIAANKVKGIRAAEVNTEDSVYLARSHNNINVLALNGLEYKGFYKKLSRKKKNKGSPVLLLDLKPKKVPLSKIKKLIDIFLKTEFEGGRHKRRLDMIE